MKLLVIVLLGWTAMMVRSPGGSIDWGTAFNDELYDAGGSPLTAAFEFEMGTFSGGFVPTLANSGAWESQWKAMETASFNAPMQYVAENSILTSNGPDLIWERDQTGDEEAALSNPHLFAPGETVYVWTFNSKTLTEATQWALVTGAGATLDTDWTLSAALGDPVATTRQWRLSNADLSIVGGLHDLRGPGSYDATPASFTLQTTLMVPIPEPGSSVLLVFAAVLSLRRRPPFHPS